MRRRAEWLLAMLGALLVLAGCSLARPEAAVSDPRFMGFYLVREDSDAGGRGFYQNPNLTEYGASAVTLDGYGTFHIPDRVLFAVKEGDEWMFPGLEGWRLFVYHGVFDDGSAYQGFASDMAPGEGNHVKITDEGTTDIINGVLYQGPPLGQEDWDPYEDKSIWTAYRVYQAPDGRPYLDGSGNSFSGALGSYQETRTYTSTENGGVVKEDIIEVNVSMEAVPRLERLTVVRFGADHLPLCTQELPLEGDLPDVSCGSETAWVLVEEHSGEGVRRTAYTPPGPGEEAAVHQVVVLDEAGIGRQAALRILGEH